MPCRWLFILGALSLNSAGVLAASSVPPGLDAANVILTAPTQDASGALPLGNGQIGVSAWVEPSGDLVFYISHTDSFSEVCRLLKIGKVRVHLSPAPEVGASFREELNIREGRLVVDLGGTHLELFVDAHHPVIDIAGHSDQPRTVTVSQEGWRTERRVLTGTERDRSAWTMKGAPADVEVTEDPDVIVPATQAPGAIAWYHRNETSIVPLTLKHEGVDQVPGTFDPLLHRTFGAWIEGIGFSRQADGTLATASSVASFDLRIACPVLIADTADDWIKAAQSALATAPALDQARQETEAAWAAFWNRSWVVATLPASAELAPDALTRGYNLSRYVFACQGRGEFPIKFNGGIFTLEPSLANPKFPFNADWRNWGDAYWYQNTRHMYHPMLMAGDFDLMAPFFALYQRSLPLAEGRSKIYYHAEGAYFPEVMTIFGTYANGDYGWKPKTNPGDVSAPYWRTAWNQGPELISVMLDYWDWTQDQTFLQKTLLPTARAVLNYFDTRFQHDADGRIVLDPTQAVESFRRGVVNDMPTTAGLHDITTRLAALPGNLVSADDHAFFAKMQAACPVIPVEERTPKGATALVRSLAVAQKYDPHRGNIENPELYAVWPFHLYGVGLPDLDVARNAFTTRGHYLPVGWGPDGNAAARLGLTDSAAAILEKKLANSHKGYSFPATWGPNYDWLPDQNHAGNLLETTQLMLMQSVGRKILLFLAWPKTWDVQFKLHAPGNTVVEGSFSKGKAGPIIVTPPERAADVIDCSTLDVAAIEQAIGQP